MKCYVSYDEFAILVQYKKSRLLHLLHKSLLFSHYSLNSRLSIHLNGFHTRLLVLIEVETQQVSLVKMVIVQILRNLLFTLDVVFLTTPDFQLHNIMTTHKFQLFHLPSVQLTLATPHIIYLEP